MDLTTKVIPVFFALILLANYFNFLGFWLILRNLPAIQGRHLRKRTKFYFVSMHVIYLAIIGMAFVPGFQPLCTDERAYPYVMTWASFLFIVNYAFHCVLNWKKEYFLVPQAQESEITDPMVDKNLANPILNGFVNESNFEDKIDWTEKESQNSMRREMFRRQMKFYICFSTILVISNIGL